MRAVHALRARLIEVTLWRWTWGGIVWSMTSTCRQNGYGFTEPYPYEVTAGGAAAGKLLADVTGSRRILFTSEVKRVGKGLKQQH